MTSEEYLWKVTSMKMYTLYIIKEDNLFRIKYVLSEKKSREKNENMSDVVIQKNRDFRKMTCGFYGWLLLLHYHLKSFSKLFKIQ
jgi:hypothetical protein